MEPFFLYFLGMFFAWVLLEFITRSGLMLSSNAALMFSLGVMMIVVSVADWLLNSPMINARTGKNISLNEYFWINSAIVFFCFLVSVFLEVKKRRSRKK